MVPWQLATAQQWISPALSLTATWPAMEVSAAPSGMATSAGTAITCQQSCTVSLRNLHLEVSRVAGSLTMPHSIHTAALCPAGSIYLSGVNSALLYNVTAKGNTALTNGGGLFSVSNSHTERHPACSPVSPHRLHTHPIYSTGPHRPVTFCRI